MSRLSKGPLGRLGFLVRILMGAVGGTVIFAGVLVLFAVAMGEGFPHAFLGRLWNGGLEETRILLGFSLFGGVIGIALLSRDMRIQAEMDMLRRTRENLLDSLLSSERFATMGSMAAEIGHEVNNYLAVARAQVELFSHTVQDTLNQKTERYLHSLTSQLTRMQTLTRGLMGLGSHRQSREDCSLNDLLRETIAFVTPLGRFDEIEFSMDLSPGLPAVKVNVQQMQQVFLNLFNNAADALAGNGGRIKVATRLVDEDGSVQMMISDNGPGIHPGILDHVFDPGFTTRADGHGYGLAVCKRIVEQHGARLNLRSEPGEGATFTLTIPGVSQPVAEFSPPADLHALPAEEAEHSVS